jgi:glutamate carboxypeptidase
MTRGEAATMLDWLGCRREEMVDLLERLVRLESPSLDAVSQRRPLALLREQFERLDFGVKHHVGVNSGGTLVARPARPARERGHQLVVGHIDTVWPQGTVRTMPVTRSDGVLHGPGAYDMKAGLVQLLFALRALIELEFGWTLAPVVVVNSDEEIGSRESRPLIERLARTARRAFVVEPSFGPGGSLKTARKGTGRFSVRIVGRASHAGLAPEAGVSAILEASHQVQRLYELTDPERGVTVNVGTIDGGMRPNVIAPLVTAGVEVRVAHGGDAAAVERAIRSLRPVQEGIEIQIDGGFGRPPLERTARNRALWEAARSQAADLGMELDEAAVGGASDGNVTSLFTATLDGLGAVGGGAHAVDEHVVVEHMPDRAALLAALLHLPGDLG